MNKYENELKEKGIIYIAGIDEVGRGPLAGPVMAAAVILKDDFSVEGVNDSKKISEKKREKMYHLIKDELVAFGIGEVDHKTIDEINILNATKLAMENAVKNLSEDLNKKDKDAKIEHLLIDALSLPDIDIPQTAIKKGDSLSISIAAASIIAKVTRDEQMRRWHETYPQYNFEKNKGYGTAEHFEALRKYGPCEIHRISFID